FFGELDTIKSSNCELNLITRKIANEKIYALTAPMFYHGEDLISNLKEISPDKIDNIELKGILVLFNLNRLEHNIMNIETVAKFEKSEEDIQVFKDVMNEQLGILMEWCMVEEMGHVVYFLNAAQ